MKKDRYFNTKLYFIEQSYTTEKYIIPFVSDMIDVNSSTKVAEVGCSEGGNLKPFLDMGCKVVGIDISEQRIKNAEKCYNDHPLKANLRLINNNIYDVKTDPELKFDLIIMRDTLEHIPDQNLLLRHLKQFLNTDGKIFISFPAWRMPFGGHQQMCNNRILSKVPYFHILPRSVYKLIMKLFGEPQSFINEQLEIKDTKISIQKFKRYVLTNGYKVKKQVYYLINPNYEIKFKMKPVELPAILNIPYLRDFFTTTVYSVIE